MIIKVAGIILAAGASSRFGSDKLQYKLDNGEYLGVLSAKKLRPFVDELKIIVPKANKTRQKIFGDFDYLVTSNKLPQLGASLKIGLAAVKNYDYCIISLADMPFISLKTYENLVRSISLQRFDLIAPSFDGKRGHPVAISSGVVNHFLSSKESGFIKNYFEDEEFSQFIFTTQDIGVLRDVDYPEDLFID
ncbi:MAG: hypothetical protein CBC29_01740 [Methylococcaceae bacterium TMED69]|nr:MAG: hypothetical protein CBC29_01740 [Methylococcaceae bacterium TMED69]